MHSTTARRHLRKLTKFGPIVAEPSRAGPRYFVAGGPPPPLRLGCALLRRPANAAFLHAIARNPEAGVVALARQLDLAKSTASERAAALREAGILVAVGHGFALAPRVLEALPALQPPRPVVDADLTVRPEERPRGA